jgi:hypothetical protein
MLPAQPQGASNASSSASATAFSRASREQLQPAPSKRLHPDQHALRVDASVGSKECAQVQRTDPRESESEALYTSPRTRSTPRRSTRPQSGRLDRLEGVCAGAKKRTPGSPSWRRYIHLRAHHRHQLDAPRGGCADARNGPQGVRVGGVIYIFAHPIDIISTGLKSETARSKAAQS